MKSVFEISAARKSGHKIEEAAPKVDRAEQSFAGKPAQILDFPSPSRLSDKFKYRSRLIELYTEYWSMGFWGLLRSDLNEEVLAQLADAIDDGQDLESLRSIYRKF